MTIGEYLAIVQPEVYAALAAWARPAESLVLMDVILVDVTAKLFETEDPDPEIEWLMRHDAYRRGKGGALRQVVHA